MSDVDRRILGRLDSSFLPFWLASAIVVFAAVFLVGCSRSEDAGGISHTRDAEAPDVVAMATATQLAGDPNSSLLPTERPSLTAVGSEPATVPTAVGNMLTSPTPGCQHVYFFEPSPVECPLAAYEVSAAAEQPFERGFMIWVEVTDSIYVFDWEGRWRQYEDTFEEGQQEFDADINPPAGMYQPIRGFGKIWREYPRVREQLGWALGQELGFDSAIQAQTVEVGSPQVTFLRAFNGQVQGLTTRSPGEGDWVVAAS